MSPTHENAAGRVRLVGPAGWKGPLRGSIRWRADLLVRTIEERARAKQNLEVAQHVKPAASPFAVGDQVVHATLGTGVVKAVKGAGEGAKLTVQFDAGERVLKAAFLKKQ